ncbi:response regulator transcription factor [Saccharopolyspora mangrovi]|uniref:Response regulator transcription factor n=1 Tax=Saccharopolyspora mangrovi TaxID=3082379 RepID=A0ABU6AHB5_9PSEU|nr:response regulator transcription factor [Saccharopolyspora sp. S2-29]MEB3370959.1 response regulator transcription factor [Saccharopolyspora sp. S2-29]
MKHVLVAEDEKGIALLLQQSLRAEGFGATVVSDGEQARRYALSGGYDLLVLDIGLPATDGFTVLRQLREAGSRLPIIVLTARSGVADTVAGLEGGADDYVGKPFRMQELLARIRLRIRNGENAHLLRCCDLTLDLRTRRLHVDGRIVDLTAREFALAEVFMRNPGTVLTREQLIAAAWSDDNHPASNVIDVYVRYLRRKTGAHWISTVRGKGYRLDDSTTRLPADSRG